MSTEATIVGDKKDGKKQVLPSCTVGELFQFADSWDCVLYVFGTIAAIVNGLTMPLFSLIFGALLDSFNAAGGNTDLMDDIKPLALYISLAGVAAWVFSYLEVALFQISAERQGRKLRDAYFAALLNQNIGWFDSQTTEALVTKVADESRTFIDGMGSKLGLGIRCFTTFVGGFILAFIEGWQLTLVLCAMAPLMAVGGAVMMKLMADIEGQSAKMYAEAGAIAQERLSAIRTVQTFGGQKEAVDKYGVKLDVTLKAGIKQGFVQGGSMGFTWFVMFAMFGVAFWYGSTLIADDREDVLADLAALGCPALPDFSVTCSDSYKTTNPGACASFCDTNVIPCLDGDTCHTGGNVVLVFFAVIIGAMGIGQANPSATSLAKARVAGYEMFSVIHREVAISTASSKGRPVSKDHMRGAIRFNNVHFSYPSRPDRKVLNGVNLTIEAGTTVALVGRSGCGKSTLVSLIQRFYDPTSGTVELDNLGPLTELHVAGLRSAMGLVGQEPVLFATTVKDNIKFGAPLREASDAEVEAAARLANAHDFIMDFDKQYDTMVGGRGSALSGGQKQRVAIARAVIRKPKILLLDEATSALDSHSEVAVQEALNGLMASGEHTTVVIAHRLSTIKNADNIVVMDAGRVVEQGTHDELMAIEGGIYRDLVEAQSSGRDGTLAELDASATSETKANDADPRGASVSRGKSASVDRRTMSVSKEQSVVKEADPDIDTSVKRIFKMSLPEWPWIIVAMLSAMVYGSQNPLFAVAFSEMVALFFEPKIQDMRDDSLFWALGFGVLAVAASLSALFMFGAFGILGQSMGRRLREMALNAMLHKDMAFHDDEENTTGALSTQLASDATLVNSMASQRTAIVAQNFVAMCVGLGIAFSSDWRLSLVVLGVGPVLVLAGDLQMRAFTGQTQKVQKSLEKAGHVVEESVHGIRTVASFDLAEEMCQRYRERLVEPQRQGIKGGHTSGFGFGFSQFAMFGVYGLTFYVGGLWIEDGSLTFRDMMLVMMAIMMTAMAIGESSSMAPDATKAKNAVINIFTTIDKLPSIDSEYSKQRTKLSPASVEGTVQFRDVSFTYPTREGRVLSHFNLKVPAGSSVALVGSSGSGKSTIVQLLQRFYDPDSGVVSLDGHNLKSLDVQWLRRQLGVVSQEPTLFNGTVADNIAYGKCAFPNADLGDLIEVQLYASDNAAGAKAGDASRVSTGVQRVPAAIVQAAKDANAHDFITCMAEGYHTVIKPDSLSGGQKQRVAIARAILRDPPILLLDEATSALDNRSEQVVQEALDRLMALKRRTTIVVAHRLSTIYQSDHIVVMHQGEIVEQGTHDFLTSDAAPSGKYRTMWEQQRLVGNGGGSPA